MADTYWSGDSANKLYLTSGQFTSTLKNSVAVGGVDTFPQDISWDGQNNPWIGFQAGKLYLQSGLTSTLKTSLSVSAKDYAPVGISWSGSDTAWTGQGAGKLFLYSGQFTSTIKTSQALSISSIQSASVDDTNTTITRTDTDKLVLYSGIFTNTIKSSVSVGAVDNTPQGNTFDYVNSPWTGSGDDKLYLQSGQFTSTLKTSQSVGAVDGTPSGIETSDWEARLNTTIRQLSTVTVATGTTSDPLDDTHTVDAGTDILVVIAGGTSSPSGVSSVSFDGDGLSLKVEETRNIAGTNDPHVSIWYLVSPTAKSATISMQPDDATPNTMWWVAVNFSNVDTADPWDDNVVSANGNTTTATGSLTTTETGTYIITGTTVDSASSVAPNGTAHISIGESGSLGGGSASGGAGLKYAPTAGSYSPSWVFSSNDWSYVSAALRAEAAPEPPAGGGKLLTLLGAGS